MKLFKRKKIKKAICPFCGKEMKRQKDRYICPLCLSELKGDTLIFNHNDQDFQN